MKSTAALFSFAMVFTVACFSATSETGDTITPEVLSAITHQALIVDVRTSVEFADGHYPGAINISHETILEGLNQLGVTADTSVILYCRSGNRSQTAVDQMSAVGINGIYELESGTNGWAAAGQPLVQ